MKACIEFFKFVKERVLSQTQIFYPYIFETWRHEPLIFQT